MPDPTPSIQELWVKIQANEARIAALEARHNILDAKNTAVEKGLRRRGRN